MIDRRHFILTTAATAIAATMPVPMSQARPHYIVRSGCITATLLAGENEFSIAFEGRPDMSRVVRPWQEVQFASRAGWENHMPSDWYWVR